MKFDKKQFGVVLVGSGLAAAGFWLAQSTGGTGLSTPPASKAGSQIASNGAPSPATRTAPPGAGGAKLSGETNTSPFVPNRPGVAGHQIPETAPVVVTGTDHGLAGHPIAGKSADPAPSDGRPKTPRSWQQDETSATAAEAPAFRAMTGVGETPSTAGAPASVDPVVLEFAEHQQLPAVLVADAASSAGAGTDPRQATTSAMAATIAREFVATVTAPSVPAATTPAPAETSAPSPTPTDSSLGEAPSGPDPATIDPITPEQRWGSAANHADEQYRLLIGQDEYQRKSIQAAILKQQQAATIP